uniref:Bulb-type lectin domain-containing protein n=1 Tax=Fagus sylvatica TaxID=28930 RepID=A0A2N9JBM5_FAGSY
MEAILFILLLSAIFSAEAQQNESIISLGSFLKPTTNSSWLSRSGLYAFGFYQQSNGYAVGVFLAGIPGKTVVWTANRDNPPVLANLGDGLVYEVVDGSNSFPHFYGPSRSFSPLPLNAVTKAEKLSLLDGRFSCSLLD